MNQRHRRLATLHRTHQRLADYERAEQVRAAMPDFITAESAFWLSRADLRTLAASGDANAQREIMRRAVNRANRAVLATR